MDVRTDLAIESREMYIKKHNREIDFSYKDHLSLPEY